MTEKLSRFEIGKARMPLAQDNRTPAHIATARLAGKRDLLARVDCLKRKRETKSSDKNSCDH